MEFVFALPDACSVAWGDSGLLIRKGDAYPADDPFVLAHREIFSRVPSKLFATDGRELPVAVPLSQEEPAPAEPFRHRDRGGRNG